MYARRQIVSFLLLILPLSTIIAEEPMNHCEIGLQGGCGYYVGDAEKMIFKQVHEAYGADFRYLFTRRWALRVQGLGQKISGYKPDGTGFASEQMGKWVNQLVNIDAAAEFNFFRFGNAQYDTRIKVISPYIGLGLGMCLHGLNSQQVKAAAYVPFYVGVKWQMSPHTTMKLAWQHNIYLDDNMENLPAYNNTYGLNGTNLMNVDVTGQLTLGIGVQFVTDGKVCRRCEI